MYHFNTVQSRRALAILTVVLSGILTSLGNPVITDSLCAPIIEGVPSDTTVDCTSIPAPATISVSSAGGDTTGVNFTYWDGTAFSFGASNMLIDFFGDASTIPTGAIGAGVTANVQNPDRAAASGGLGDWVYVRFSAGLNIDVAGTYEFCTNSNDGSRIYIDGASVVDNDGTHSTFMQCGSIFLTTGCHEFVLQYYNGPSTGSLQTAWTVPGGTQTIIPDDVFSLACEGGITSTFDETTGICSSGSYDITRTWTATNSCGTITETQVLSVLDNDAPILSGVPLDLIVLCGDSVPAPPTVTASDCDPTVTVNYSEVTTSFGFTRTWSSTDECGNTATATQLISIGDVGEPIITGVPADITVSCDAIPGIATVTAMDVNGVPLTVTFAETNGSGCPFVLKRLWFATDTCGLTNIDTQLITVVDLIAPVLIGVPGDITLSCGDPIPSAPTVTASDNCDPSLPVIFDETTSPTGIIRTWSTIDDCGNSDLQIQHITIIDSGEPILFGVPADITVSCDSVPAPATGVTAINVNGDTLVVSFTENNGSGCPFVIKRFWFATDECGLINIDTQLITVQDIVAPILIGVPGDTVIGCDETIPLAPTVTATDNCDPSLPVIFDEVITATGLTRTWSSADNCGNEIILTQILTVLTESIPTLIGVPSNQEVSCDAIPATATVTAVDGEGNPVAVTFSESSTFPGCPYTITRTWSATDPCDISSSVVGTQVLTVSDITPPILNGVPADTVLTCGAALPAAPTVTGLDNCDPTLFIAFDETPTATGLIRTWGTFDNCGNAVTADQIITIIPTGTPTLIGVPADLTVSCDAIPGPPTVTSTDILGNVLTVNYSASSTAPGCPYTITRTWSATDNCGEHISLSQIITVEDTEAPVLSTVPGDITLTCGDPIPAAATVLSIDNCDFAVTVDFLETTTLTGLARTWSALDNCGNSVSATQIITIIPSGLPTLIGVPFDVSVSCDAIPGVASVTAVDILGAPLAVSYSESSTSGCAYSITRTWSTTDMCSLTTTASQVISTFDNTDPVILGVPADFTVLCGEPVSTAPSLTATDNCDTSLSVSLTETATATGLTRTWTTSDDCGNTDSYTQNITIELYFDPVISGVPSDLTVSCDAIPGVATVTALDYLGNPLAVTFNETSETPFCSYVITRTWSATDSCGGNSMVTQLITVEDTEAPVLIGIPADTLIACGDSIPVAASVTAIDNCDPSPSLSYSEIVSGDSLLRTWSTTDTCSNLNTITQIIILEVCPNGPIANNDTTETCAGSLASIEVLANDESTGPPIASSTVTVLTSPVNGMVFIGGGGTAFYTPNPGFSGMDSFTYTVEAVSSALSNIATVYINVKAGPVIALVNTTDATGCNINNGKLEIDLADIVSGPGPYNLLINGTYPFGPFATEPMLIDIVPGGATIFNIEVENANGCSAVDNNIYKVKKPDFIVQSISTTAENCTTGLGEITINLNNAAAGTAPYKVRISGVIYGPFASEPVVVPLPAGTYAAIGIRDATNCTAFRPSAVIIPPCPPPCPKPDGLSSVPGEDNVNLFWNAVLGGTGNYLVEWRESGMTSWNMETSSFEAKFLNDLDACTLYEWRVAALCTSDTSDWSIVNTFTTGGCRLGITPDFLETAAYPNPASESINLDIALSQEANVSVEVYDITGRLIFAEKAGFVSAWQKLLDLSNHSSGVYTVNWIVDESLTIDRFNISR